MCVIFVAECLVFNYVCLNDLTMTMLAWFNIILQNPHWSTQKHILMKVSVTKLFSAHISYSFLDKHVTYVLQLSYSVQVEW